MRIVTIMDYPPNNKNYLLMCYIWLDLVIKHGSKNILILYHSHRPSIVDMFKGRADIQTRREKQGPGDHINIRFKLKVLSSLKSPFIFIDSDAYVLHDLNHLWQVRNDKPWIGINHQWIPRLPDTHRKPFLNSGIQIIGDPDFYNYEEIMKTHKNSYCVPGRDQAVLFRYFRTIGYDYTHPEVGTEWNSCSMVGKLKKTDGEWHGHTVGLEDNHPVYINHYWCENKPWTIKCPLHEEYAKTIKL